MATIQNSVENLMAAFRATEGNLDVLDATLEGHGPVKVVGKRDTYGFYPLAVLMTEDLYEKVLPPEGRMERESEEQKEIRAAMIDLETALRDSDGSGDAA